MDNRFYMNLLFSLSLKVDHIKIVIKIVIQKLSLDLDFLITYSSKSNAIDKLFYNNFTNSWCDKFLLILIWTHH